MIAAYEAKKDQNSLDELQAQMDTDEPFIQEIQVAIISLTNLIKEVGNRRLHIEGIEGQVVGGAQPKQEGEGIQEMAQAIVQLTQQLAAQAVAAPAAPPVAVPAADPAPNFTIKLPKLDMHKFTGDIMKWSGFWQQFQTAIHNNARVATVDKFNYLVGLLEGEALSKISGLQITVDNYQVAINMLTERFGKQDVIIAAHYDSIFQLSSTTSSIFKL